MRIRGSSKEIVFTMGEFRKLDLAELCRRYGWGDDEWLDLLRNKQAEKEVLDGAPSAV